MIFPITRGRMAPSGARPSTGPEKRSAPRAGQRLAGAVARRWRPPARSLRGRDRRYSARVSLVSVEVVVLGAGERATRFPHPDLLPQGEGTHKHGHITSAERCWWCGTEEIWRLM